MHFLCQACQFVNLISVLTEYGPYICTYFRVATNQTAESEQHRNQNINENGINELSIFPNPFSYNATISFNVEGLERTTIEVFNTIGQNVQSFDLGIVSGNQMVQLDATELPAGFYLINIKSGNNTVTSRVTVNK